MIMLFLLGAIDHATATAKASLTLPSGSNAAPDTLEDRGGNQDAASQIGLDDEDLMEIPEGKRLPRPTYSPVAEPFPRKRSRLIEVDDPQDQTTIEMDSLGRYHVTRTIRDVEVAIPRYMEFEEFAAENKKKSLRDNWERLVEESERRRDDRRGLLDFTLDLPIDEESAFATIFGRPEVNLNVSGQANMNIGASIQETEDPSLPPDQQTRIDPLFNQDLQLSIEGTIGDKLFIQTDWDTERSFDWQNRLNIFYEGYEDEIIQSIQLGNVSMETGNSLIRGGSALFGIKSEMQFGPLTLTSVISQQEGDSQTETISDGSTEQEIEVRPTDYQEDRHFFLDYYSRQEFERVMSDPVISTRLYDITRMDVYLLNISEEAEDDQRRAIALTDLGTIEDADGRYSIPNQTQDRFDEELLEAYRDRDASVSASDLGVESDEFEEGYFKPLQEGEDYTFDASRGYISLERSISDRQAVAVSFAHRSDGEIINVGDVNEGGSDRIFLKLLRPSNLSTSSDAWDLMMRNVYSLNATDLRPDDIDIDLYYTGGNTDQTNLPSLGNRLLRDLGLDRVNSEGEPGPNNELDFGTGTLDAQNGRIIFPYLEPFGERIKELYEESDLPAPEVEEAIERYAFPELYRESVSNARNRSRDNNYRILGTTRGGVQESYNLGYALVEGSVSVSADGVELTEGTDYEVDYSVGNIIITNERYLEPGQDIEIDYENQQAVQIQQTTFAGLRADYDVSENIQLGGIYFALSERPNQDKLMVGDEPISSSVIGFDGDAEFEAPWITRALDWLPILSTREESRISVSGEFAQLRPGVSQPPAVQRAIDDGELFPDEERGISYIDHFEGSRRNIDISRAGRWNLAAAPLGIPGYDQDVDNPESGLDAHGERSDMRAQFSWYTVPRATERLTGVNPADYPETRPVSVHDVFPNRDVERGEDRLETLDVYYNPHERGPYNYNHDLRDLLENRREDMWGGMTTTLASGQDNLRRDNIEFLEFWVQPVLPEGREGSGMDLENYDGNIYIDLGSVNEDVMASGIINSEDGLARAMDRNNVEVGPQGRSYVVRQRDFTGQFTTETIDIDNVGLDGATSGDGEFSEQNLFADFLDRMEEVYEDDPEMLERIQQDPSNDNFVYFEEAAVSDKPLPERFHRMNGYYEGNALSAGDRRPVTNRPNTEGLLNSARLNTDDSHFQYQINFNPADSTSLSIGESNIVDKVDGPTPTDRWYLVRIPLDEYERRVGNIDDLERVSHIRMWMSGYSEPFTMRFASMELVGNQWQIEPDLNELDFDDTDFQITTINIEENANRQPIPYRSPIGAIRPRDRTSQEQTRGNEQSLQLNVENLQSGDIRFIRRSYSDALDLLNYSNLRMFVHGEGYEDREDVQLVLRFGNDLENDYYEYRQPVSPTDPDYQFQRVRGEDGESLDSATEQEEAERVWMPDSNNVNIVLSSLNALKQARDLDDFDESELYLRDDLLEDAAPGAEIAIKGNPSLVGVNEVAIGVRNPHGEETGRGVPSLDAELWVNELRVSGFDDDDGWAANVSARIDMADFATVNARYNQETDGFGALDSGLGDRRTSDMTSYRLSSDMNLHRFLPERYGWNIPLSLSGTRRTVTPRYLPQEGDIRFSDFEDAVRASDLPEDEQDEEIDSMLDQIRTVENSYSIGLSGISKSNSQSPVLQYTLDNIRLSYRYNIDEARSDRHLFNDSWNYQFSGDYDLSIPEINRLHPFSMFEGWPIFGMFSDVGFAYLPSSFNAGASLRRDYSERQQRHFEGEDPFDVEQSHSFRLSTDFGFNYSLTRTLTTQFSSSSSLDLASIAVEDFEDIDIFRTRSSFEVFEDILFDDDISPRRSDYDESYSANWSPNIDNIRYMDWFQYDASYRGSFSWENRPEGSGLGADISNSITLDHDPVIRTQNLFERIPYYESLQDASDAAQADRQQRRDERDRIREEMEETDDEEELEALEAEMPEREPGETILQIGRRVLLSLFSLRDINVSYSTSVNSVRPGYTGGTRIYHMFNDETDAEFSPPLAYRMGFTHEIPITQMARPDDPDQIIDFEERRTTTDDLSVRSGIQPFENIRVDLDWGTTWDETITENHTVTVDDISTEFDESGNVSSSIWAFGPGYEELFRSQLSRAFRDLENGEINQPEPGEAILRSGGLNDDFRDAYMMFSGARLGRLDYIAFPMPNWNLNWSGLENHIPFIQDYLSSASINHSYNGRLQMGWRLHQDAGEEVSRNIGNISVNTFRSDYDPSSLNLERRFSPLVGLSLNWTSGLRTNIDYEHSESVSLSFSNNNVREQVSRGIRLSANFSQSGFTLPFLRRFENQIDLGLSFSYFEDMTFTYRLNQDLEGVLGEPLDEIDRDPGAHTPPDPERQGDTRINIQPSIGYQFSQTITVNFEYTYNRLLPESSNVFPRTDQDFRFNVVVNIRSN